MEKARKIVAKRDHWVGKSGSLPENVALAVAEGIALGRKQVFFVLSLLILAIYPGGYACARPLGVADLPALAEVEKDEFDKNVMGKLFTGQMTVGYVMRKNRMYGVEFTNKGMPDLGCHLDNESDLITAKEGDVLWVSGIVTPSLYKGKIILKPCEISLTREPWDPPKAWKLHPPRQ